MNILKIYPTSLNRRFIDEAVDVLRNGGIIVYPTDSVYALGCDALNNKAIERICKLKKIDPRKENLSIVCNDISQASEYARIDNTAFRLMRQNLPSPITMILPAATTLPKVFKGRRTVGVRIPDNTIARAIAEALGNPILSTSAVDDSDGDDMSNPEAIAVKYSQIADLMINGGNGCTDYSTVVDLSDPCSPEIVRQGLGNFVN